MRNTKQITWAVSLALLVIVAWVFRDKLDFISEGLARISQANPLAVALVLFFALGSVAAMADVMRLLIKAGKCKVRLRDTYALTLAANSWSTTLPAGPAFAAILTFQVQGTWGASMALRSYFFFLSSIISTISLAVIGLAGVFFLNADMALGSLVSTIVLMVLACGTIFWISANPMPVIDWLKRQKVIKGKFKDRLIKELGNLKQVKLTLPAFGLVSGMSFAHRLCDLLALWACVWAVTGVIPWLRASETSTTIAGVALAFLAAKIAGSAQVTPAGLGTVEAALIGPLVATGMGAADATSAAIIYRLISFALVTFIGWLVYFFYYARRGLTYKALNRKD